MKLPASVRRNSHRLQAVSYTHLDVYKRQVITYAYTQGIYSSRRIAKALRENINFMWISAGNQPDFRTINRFRSERIKGVIDEIFASVLEVLIEEGYVKLEDYFIDGTKIEANANRYSYCLLYTSRCV